MTIKRRLFLSNILMVTLPVLLTIVMFLITAAFFFGLTGTHSDDYGGHRVDYVDDTEAAALLQTQEYVPVANIPVYRSDANGYLVVLPNNEELPPGFGNANADPTVHLLMLLALVVIVYLTNWVLTRVIYRSIMTPIDILVNGVHEIRDGNLGHRIDYKKKDEFASVCDDFNQMTDRLLEMVTARRRDEESRRELIAGISHDLRTPLTSIKTYVEGIELGMASTPEKHSHYLATIKSKANDLEHIIHQLFQFSKLDVGEFPMQLVRIELGKWLSDFVYSVSEEYERSGLRITLEESSCDVAVSVDNVQLRNVLLNVLGNSVKYGNHEQGEVEISCCCKISTAVITISDNGPGVPADMLEKMFEVFYRGDQARSNTNQGSGLGLAISAKIMERLGGSIEAENRPEGGLSIILTLPIQGGDHEKDIDY